MGAAHAALAPFYVYMPLHFTQNANAPPRPYNVALGVVIPVPPPTSLQGAMLLDAGRIPNVPFASILNPPAAGVWEPAATIVERLRSYVRYDGFKAVAATALFGPTVPGDGLTGATATTFIYSMQGLQAALVSGVKAALGGGPLVRCIVRIDIQYLSTKATGADNGDDRDEFVDVHNHLYKLPFVFKGQRVIVGATQAHLQTTIARIVQHFRAHINNLPTNGMSDRVFDGIVGAHIWATPTNSSHHGNPTGRIRAGTLDFSQATDDGVCIARALVSAVDPFLMSRTDTNLYTLRLRAFEGATKDTELAWKRYSVALEAGKTAEAAAYMTEFGAAEARLFKTSTALGRALKLCRERGEQPIETTTNTEPYKLARRWVSVKSALALATRGKHPLFDLSSDFFRSPQPIDDSTVAFIRSVVANNVRVQVWGEGPGGGVALNYPAEGVTLEAIENGLIVINLLATETHVSAMENVTTLCTPLTRTNQRVFCGLCGFSFAPAAATSSRSTKTLVALHQEAGCPTAQRLVMTLPLSQRNLRQLTLPELPARFRTPLFGTLLEEMHTDLSYEASLVFAGHSPGGWRALIGGADHATVVIAGQSRRENASFQKMYDPVAVTGGRTGDVLTDVYRISSNIDAIAAMDGVLRSAFVPRSVSVLLSQLRICLPMSFTHATDLIREEAGVGDPLMCYGCKFPLHGPSRWTVQLQAATTAIAGSIVGLEEPVLESDNEDTEWSPVECTDDAPTMTHCYSTGLPCWAHVQCAKALHRLRPAVSVIVGNTHTMRALVQAVCHKDFVATVLKGNLPLVSRGREGTRVVQIVVHGLGTDGTLAVRFKAPSSIHLPTDAVSEPVTESTATHVQHSVKLATSVLQWCERGFKFSGLWPLAWDSDIAFSKAALYDSQLHSERVATSLVSLKALEEYNRMTKGGRILVGCAVMHPPLEHPLDRRTVRLHFDVTAMYPSILLHYPLPRQEHTDRVLHDFTANLDAGVAYLKGVNVKDPLVPAQRVVISGVFPQSTHRRLAQFPPVYQRMFVQPSWFTPFQRKRMGVSLTSPPEEHNVAHLMPIDKMVVFVKEAQLMLRLGFVPTYIGEVSGCDAGFWAQPFAAMVQRWRTSAAAVNDKESVAASKLFINSVIGAINMNASKFTTLKGVRTEDINPATLEAVHGLTGPSDMDDVSEATSVVAAAGKKRPRAYKQNLADNPRFTGRTWDCGAATYLELSQGAVFHTQMTAASLAVQAYARCAQAEMFYGDGATHKGIVDIFPDAKVLGGNTDSLIVEISLTAGQTAAGYTDARVALWNGMPRVFDISNIPNTSTFWNALDTFYGYDISSHELQGVGEWGLLKEITGWAGYDAVVMNGPNRWGARVVQSETDTLPEHRERPDVIKSLPKAWAGKTTLEQYAANWGGGHSPEEHAALVATASTETPIPIEGTCVWGNSACVVAEDGRHWPFGAHLPEALAEIEPIPALAAGVPRDLLPLHVIT